VSTDPLFVNPNGLDFHLNSGSPAIDTGLSLPQVLNDFDGVSRPQGSGYDIGAFEFQTHAASIKAKAVMNVLNPYFAHYRRWQLERWRTMRSHGFKERVQDIPMQASTVDIDRHFASQFKRPRS
jgi:hypothetical protein